MSQTRPDDRYAGKSWIFFSTVSLGVLGIALFAAIIDLWPAVDRGANASATTKVGVDLLFGAVPVDVTLSTGLILLALVAGAVGAFIHTTTSFVTYVGNRRLKASWISWYALRLFVGSALSLVLYFAFRGGLLTTDASSDEVNPYGIAALSGLTGLFSKQATDKLKEVFDTFFRTAPGQGDSARGDKPSQPKLRQLDPSSVAVGQTPPVRVLGEGFEQDALVLVGGEPRPTDYQNEGELTVTLSAADTLAAGSLSITVKGPGPEGPTSDSLTLTVA